MQILKSFTFRLVLAFTLILYFAPASFALESSIEGILVDDLGKIIEINNVTRILSLEPAIIEALYLSGHFDKLVGVAKSSMSENWPKEVDSVESVGDIRNVNVEKIVDLKHDLIFGDTQQAEKEIAKLTALLEEVRENIKVNELKTAIFLYNLKPVMAFGNGSIPDQVLTLVGLKNIARDIEGNNSTFSIEELLDLNPDYIFFAMRAKSGLKEMKNNPLWNELTAVKNGKCLIPPTEHVLRPTPRLIYGIYEINKLVYQ
ncbi:MAG: ABC transporter substrate-binding protein [Halanaerobiales bacterium]|nr:ABC transporter substrate-binding protein [Halanaerobiales bacterium]